MAPGGDRIPARRARRALCALATAVVAGMALPAGAAAACDPLLPAEGITTPATGCEVTAAFHVVPNVTPVRLNPGDTLFVDGSDSSSTVGPIASWAWDWGSGTFGPDSGSATASQAFPTRNVYDVRVRATDGASTPNVQASAPTRVLVAYALTGDFTATATAQARTFDFNASATETGAASISYQWDFNGDGVYDTSPSSTASVQHTYPSDGNYTAKLLITDDLGQTVLAVHGVSAFNQPPLLTTASVAPNPAFVGAPVTLTANASDADGTIVSYLWDIDGNGSADWSSPAAPGGATFQVAYPNPGTIPVRIGAQDDSGGVTWQTILLTVNLPGGGNGTIDGGGALGLGAPGTATGPGAGSGGRGGVGFTASLGGTPFQRLKIVRKRGVSFTCSASHAATCSVSVWLAAKDARALRVNRKAKRPIVLAAFRADIAAGKTVGFTLKASGKLRSALARTRKLALTFQGVATEKGSARRLSLSRVIVLRR
ncbi:MAG TPA: PKD domain-containing protein [Solirubrobacteraceae bacterium]|nr:PKD domain-containing protein [Solirubrobacteraceae bacterium]